MTCHTSRRPCHLRRHQSECISRLQLLGESGMQRRFDGHSVRLSLRVRMGLLQTRKRREGLDGREEWRRSCNTRDLVPSWLVVRRRIRVRTRTIHIHQVDQNRFVAILTHRSRGNDHTRQGIVGLFAIHDNRVLAQSGVRVPDRWRGG
jgi:hypothetical protein